MAARIVAGFMYVLYGLVLSVVSLLSLPYFAYRGVVTGKYWPSLRERLGVLPSTLNANGERSIWIHAVSVGEVMIARSLLPLLRETFPDMPVFVSVTTLTGRQVAEQQVRGASGIFFCPFDWSFCVRRVVGRIRPRVLLVVETELWPNLLRIAHASGATTVIVNGRISDRSYRRYRYIRWFLRHYLLHVDRFCMQSERYRQRIVDLGADPQRAHVTGNLKFDAVETMPPTISPVASLLPRNRTLLVAGSTLAPEEEYVLDAFELLRRTDRSLLLLLAPRHPERFDEVASLVTSRGFRLARRSALTQPVSDVDVLVLDTMGELAAVYAAADVVFVGGSLVPWGGHNVVEPAAVGRPVVFGPSMSNFEEIAAIFIEDEAAIQVSDPDDLREALARLLNDTELRASLGERARRLVERHRGAGRRIVRTTLEALGTVA